MEVPIRNYSDVEIEALVPDKLNTFSEMHSRKSPHLAIRRAILHIEHTRNT